VGSNPTPRTKFAQDLSKFLTNTANLFVTTNKFQKEIIKIGWGEVIFWVEEK